MTVRLDPQQAKSHSRSAAPPGWPRASVIAAICLLAFGAALRIGRFVHWRALWLDEIYLAVSIVHRGVGELLFKPLSYWQAAPPGFIVSTRACVRIFGPTERALRLTSFVFGLASLPLFMGVARRCLSPRGGLVAVAMFAVLGPLIYYSNELKQYSGDVTVTLAITLAALRWIQLPTTSNTVWAAAVGAAGIFFSHPAMFVLAGVGAVALIGYWSDGRKQPLATLLAPPLVWAIAFAVAYLLFFRPLSQWVSQTTLVAYWEERHAFMPLSPWYLAPCKAGLWTFHRFWAICNDAGAMWLEQSAPVAMAMLILGLVAVIVRPDRRLLLILSPVLFALAASALRRYPFGDRLVLYLVPAMLILMGAAVDVLWRIRPRGLFAVIAAVALLGLSTTRATRYLLHPPGREETLPVYQWIARQWQAGDTIYLSHYATTSYDYYEPAAGFKTAPELTGAVLVQPAYDDGHEEFLNDFHRLPRNHRIWYVCIHAINAVGVDERDLMAPQLDRIAERKAEFRTEGAGVILYDRPNTGVPSTAATR